MKNHLFYKKKMTVPAPIQMDVFFLSDSIFVRIIIMWLKCNILNMLRIDIEILTSFFLNIISNKHAFRFKII